jgi:catechol 2,3-dioxygenase-like lactoylglutathione lyase family enzyme
MITRLGHLCLKTAQFDTLVAFYRDVLGLPVKFTFINKDGALFGAYFDLGHMTFLEIFDQQGTSRQWGGSTDTLKANDNTFYQHFCFEISGIEAYREKLVSKGVAVTGVNVGMDGSKQAWIRDPDGNRIELMEYTPASLQVKAGLGHVAR